MNQKPLIQDLITQIKQYQGFDSHQDPEKLHQVRVKIRNLMSLLKKGSKSYRVLKALIKGSNRIRDMDVLLTQSIADLPKTVEEHLHSITVQITTEKLTLESQFKQQFTEDFLDNLYNMLEHELSQADFINNETEKSANTHPITLASIKTKLNRYEQTLLKSKLGNNALHTLRLKIKKIRYQVGHFYPDKEKLLAKLKFLQTNLGEFNDKVVCLQILNPYLSQHPKLQNEVTASIHQQQSKILKKIRSKLS